VVASARPRSAARAHAAQARPRVTAAGVCVEVTPKEGFSYSIVLATLEKGEVA
jgi:hypothetical protein